MFNQLIIKNNYNKLTKQEKLVADYALKKEFDIIHISIGDIAKDTRTSPATVNRTFSKMGFSGFKYYKMYLFSNLKNNVTSSNELEFQEKHLIQSIKNTYSTIDNKTRIEKIIEAIYKNKNSITIISEGFNVYIAKTLSSKLMKIGFNIKLFDENLYTGALQSNLFIVLSSTMINESLHKKISMFKNMCPNAESIIITTNQLIKNNYDYDYVLAGNCIDNFRMNSKELPSDSMVILLIICNYLFDKIYEKQKDEYDTIIEKIKW
ncbi:MurR/RpiR family transcriptional regulator [Malacoplasma iowae]|uniref:MurR/RpiR family transcriptional regulator n=1 Tax=Malacoplasma iowae TaxID=2116 RepID=UPI002A18C84C|nr:hypothetical protein [Malacoplasma iowae]WPL40255.1 hypothetical protein QX183_01725 [Malacoplasma iowae]